MNVFASFSGLPGTHPCVNTPTTQIAAEGPGSEHAEDEEGGQGEMLKV